MKPQIIRVRNENNDFQYVETLRRNRSKRHQAREFVVEGVRAINGLLAAGWPISTFLYSHERQLSGWATDILAASSAKRHLELSNPLLDKLSGKEESSELLAVATIPQDDLRRIPHRGDLRVVLLDRPANPGNLGTIIRTCDALGVDGVIISGHAVDLYSPETLNASAGSLFALPIVRIAGPADLMPWLTAVRDLDNGLHIVGTSAKGAIAISEHHFQLPTLLLIGNETWGLSAAYKELCDVLVTIPMGGTASSLNVANATAIILYELDRQLRQHQP